MYPVAINRNPEISNRIIINFLNPAGYLSLSIFQLLNMRSDESNKAMPNKRKPMLRKLSYKKAAVGSISDAKRPMMPMSKNIIPVIIFIFVVPLLNIE
jgi:hypothetical protein